MSENELITEEQAEEARRSLDEAKQIICRYENQKSAVRARQMREQAAMPPEPPPVDEYGRTPVRDGFVRLVYTGPRSRGVFVGLNHLSYNLGSQAVGAGGVSSGAVAFVDMHPNQVAAFRREIDHYIAEDLLTVEGGELPEVDGE